MVGVMAEVVVEGVVVAIPEAEVIVVEVTVMESVVMWMIALMTQITYVWAK